MIHRIASDDPYPTPSARAPSLILTARRPIHGLACLGPRSLQPTSHASRPLPAASGTTAVRTSHLLVTGRCGTSIVSTPPPSTLRTRTRRGFDSSLLLVRTSGQCRQRQGQPSQAALGHLWARSTHSCPSPSPHRHGPFLPHTRMPICQSV